MKPHQLLLLLGLLLFGCNKQVPKEPFAAQESSTMQINVEKTKDVSMEYFITGLMKKMSLEEKIGQCVQYTSGWDVTGPAIHTDYEQWIKEGMAGSLFNAYGAEYTRKMQKIAVEETRLGIPLIFGYDVIHGYKTIFPINLGSAASWNIPLIEKSARIAAEEAAASGLHWTFSPMVDIARDPRWGRISEGAGEDTYLGSEIAKAYIRGYQGEDLKKDNTILACAKHFVAYGAAQAGRDYHTVDISERTLREIYLPPFKAALEVGVETFMAGFNELNGVPASGNEFLFRQILREEWDFKGFVVSDYTSLSEMIPHGYAKDEKDAARLGIIAGIDMDMMGSVYRKYLKTLINEGKVNQNLVEEACRRILEAKYRLGLFEDPYRYSNIEKEKNTILKPEYLETARELAAQSIVLLKNNNVLPLKTEQKIALIGPLAADESHIIGSWAASGDRNGTAVSVKEAFEEANINYIYAKGTEINTEKRNGFDDAKIAAQNSDVIVMVMGEAENMSGEAASRTEIQLPGNQQVLIKEILQTGKPVVLVLMNGRPLALQWENDNIHAIIEAWFPGTMGGYAITDVLFGRHNPSGRLNVTFPRKLGQVPVFYNYKNTGRPKNDVEEPKFRSKYLDVLNTPLYPFGYGLSYTEFEYSLPALNSKTLKSDGEIKITVTVKNTGNYDGHEVVQLYIRDKVASVTRPIKELKGFEKIYLKKGESKKVTFTLTAENLKFYNQSMEYIAEPGQFDVFVGKNAATKNKTHFLLVD